MRIPSYSLVLALILSVVIFTTANSAILESLLFQKSILTYRQNIKFSLNSISGVYLALDSEFNELESIVLPLVEKGEDSVRISVKKWGLFDIITSEAINNGKVRSKKSALVGCEFDKSNSLILSNSNRALALTGNTVIEGNCMVPKLGVKRAYIEGKSFSGKKLIDGNVIHSQLNRVPEKYKIKIDPLQKGEFTEEDSILYFDAELDTIINPFSNRRIILFCENERTYLTGYFKGNIILFSNHALELGNGLKIQDIQVIASDIILEGGNIGSGQFYASKSITCSNIVLNYPSILALNDQTSLEDENNIIINHSTIEGGVYFETTKTQAKKKSGVFIDAQSKIRGQVVSNSWVDLRGKVLGQLVTNYFFMKTASSVYENHLMDATISNKNFPNAFPLMVNNGSKSIVKWLD